jgi:exonuclease SbcD
MMFKFLHAADIHLDSPMRGLGKYENAPEEEMRGAPRTALSNLVDLAVSEACSFVVIAGDLFDGTKKDINTAFFFAEQMARLNTHGISVFIIYGNHDAETQLKTMRWPENVTILNNKKPQTIVIEELGVAIHGQSFARRDEQRNLAQLYPAPSEGLLNIGILHTALEGHPAHESYAPCSLQELINKGYDYWALGHVHEFSVRHDNPYVVFPGNLQGRSIRETGAKGAVLVQVDDGAISVEQRVLDAVRWYATEIDLATIETRGDLDSAVEGRLRDIAAAAEGRLSAVRITFVGRTPLHAHLLRHERDIGDELRVMASGMELDIWIEKTIVHTNPIYSAEEIATREDAVADLVLRIDQADEDEEFMAILRKDYASLLEKLPPAAKASSSSVLKLVQENEIKELLAEAEDYLVSQLAGGEQ